MDETNNGKSFEAGGADNIIAENFTRFHKTIVNAGLFQCDDLHVKISDGIGTTTVPLSRQFMTDDLINEMTSFLDIYVLYEYRTLDGSSYRTLAYTMPYQDEMYVLFVNSEQYGIVEEVYVVFFESLDTMFERLQKRYDFVLSKEKQIDIIQLQERIDFYRNFL